jgi:Arc/MetJ-type ribon-helix-helix transcriptional regulator
MARPKIKRHKIKTSITIDPEIYNWVQEKVKTKEFSNLTHAVERGLILLKDKLESKK